MSGRELRAERVTVRAGATAIIHGRDVSVTSGELVGLDGPSGSGKTTLLLVLAGLLKPDEGAVLLDGAPLPPGPDHRQSFVPQTLGLSPVLTAAENVSLPLQAQRLPKTVIAERRTEVLAELGLTGVADQPAGDLSGGQRQRTAIARALVTRPDRLLADEPTAQLDSSWRSTVVGLLRRMATGGGIVLVASHDEDIIGACDRVISLPV